MTYRIYIYLIWSETSQISKILLYIYMFIFTNLLFLTLFSTSILVYSADAPLASLSFESPNNLSLKSLTIKGSPWRRDTDGCHPRSSFALEMSGFLLWGSSSVFGLNSIFAFGSIVSCTTCTKITNNAYLFSNFKISTKPMSSNTVDQHCSFKIFFIVMLKFCGTHWTTMSDECR